MKKVLSLLLAYTFLQAQTWALSGGPVFESGSTQSYIGTYAGVLIPQSLDVVDSSSSGEGSAASIGLFSVGQPAAGQAVGSVLIFVDGVAFNGSLTGIIDPQDGTLKGVIDATSTFNVVSFIPEITRNEDGTTTTTFTREEFPVFAQGTIEAEVVFSQSSISATPTAGGTSTPARIEGTAAVDIFFSINNDGTPEVNKTARFEVDGFKQSDVVAGAASDNGFDFGGLN